MARPDATPGSRTKRPDNKRVTIDDVARAARTSTASVSRALSGQRGVSEALTDRVRAAAVQLGYAPNVAAQQLRQTRTRLIAVVVSDLANIVRSAWVQAAEDRADELGYNVVLVDVRLSSAALDRTLDYLLGQPLEGVVVASSIALPADRIAALRRRGIPIVPSITDSRQFRRDRRRVEDVALRDAISYLARTAHSRLAVVQHARYRHFNGQLLEFRHDALQKLCLQHHLEFSVIHDAGEPDTSIALRRLALRSGYTAVLSLTHFEVPWCLRVLRESGLRLPDDISYLTFGDSDWVRAWTPPISVIARDMEAEARHNIDLIVEQIEGDAVEHSTSTASEPARLIVRDSTPDRRPKSQPLSG